VASEVAAAARHVMPWPGCIDCGFEGGGGDSVPTAGLVHHVGSLDSIG
jgi:hypothetical protein